MKKAQGQRSEPGKVAGLKTWGKVWHAVSVMSVCRCRCCMTLDYAIQRNRIENIILIIMNSTVSESTWTCSCLQGIHEHVSDKVSSFLKSTDFPGIKFCLNDRIFSPTFLHCCRWKKEKKKRGKYTLHAFLYCYMWYTGGLHCDCDHFCLFIINSVVIIITHHREFTIAVSYNSKGKNNSSGSKF